MRSTGELLHIYNPVVQLFYLLEAMEDAMAFIPTPNVVRAAMQGSVNGNDQVYTLWAIGAAPATLTDLQNLGQALIAWALADILPVLSNGYSLDSVYLLAQDTSFAPFWTETTALPAVGAINSPVIEPQTAPVVKFATPNRGRSGRGRNYVPGCPLSALASPGVVSNTFKTNLLTAYLDLNTNIGSAGYTHVVVSHFTDNAPRAVGLTQSVGAYEMVSNSVGTQRSRRIGVGT